MSHGVNLGLKFKQKDHDVIIGDVMHNDLNKRFRCDQNTLIQKYGCGQYIRRWREHNVLKLE